MKALQLGYAKERKLTPLQTLEDTDHLLNIRAPLRQLHYTAQW